MTSGHLPRPDVPAPIAVVRDFVNTTDHETGTDELTTKAELSRYLLGEGLLPRASRATDDDLSLARRLRAGLRRALELNHDGRLDALPSLAARCASFRSGWTGPEAGRRCGSRPRGFAVRWEGSAWPPRTPPSAGIWWRLKICAYDDCEWAYYDNSKNRSRNWCEYGCGNKVKTRNYRARQRATR